MSGFNLPDGPLLTTLFNPPPPYPALRADWEDELAAEHGEAGEDDWEEREALHQAWVERQVDASYEQIDREIDACREAELFGDR